MSDLNMHLSQSPSPTRTQVSDNLFVASPRIELEKLLQREHEEALTLLESNPFISGLLIKYAKGFQIVPDRESEELIGLRFAYNALREDHAKLQETYRSAISDAAQAKHDYEVRKGEADEAYSKLQTQIVEVLRDNDCITKERDAIGEELRNSQQNLEDVKCDLDIALSTFAKEQQSKQQVEVELLSAQAELQKLQERCDFLWETISDKNRRQPRPTELELEEAPAAPEHPDLPSRPSSTVYLESPPMCGVEVPVSVPPSRLPIPYPEESSLPPNPFSYLRAATIAASNGQTEDLNAPPIPSSSLVDPSDETRRWPRHDGKKSKKWTPNRRPAPLSELLVD